MHPFYSLAVLSGYYYKINFCLIPDDHAMIMPPIGGGGAMSEETNFIQNSDQVKEQKYISPKNMQHS